MSALEIAEINLQSLYWLIYDDQFDDLLEAAEAALAERS
jgi:nitrogen fixation-related uncharacterized protein